MLNPLTAIRNFFVRLGYCSKPDFMIIGVQKSGTSSLFATLKQHHHIDSSLVKEVHYFDNDAWYSHGKDYRYHACFPLPHKRKGKSVLFEATPAYLAYPEVVERLHQYNPNLKLIVILRDPVARFFSAWSMYHYSFAKGPHQVQYDERTFPEVVGHELKYGLERTYTQDRRAYLWRGLYANQLAQLFSFFDPSQVLILELTELESFTPDLDARIQNFIGVPYSPLSMQRINATHNDKDISFYPEEVARLKAFYAPHNERLYALINRNFGW